MKYNRPKGFHAVGDWLGRLPRGLVIGVCIGLGAVVLGLAGLGVWHEFGPARLFGIDVSHYQGDVSWRALKEGGIQFVYIKATEGKSFTDPKFSQNWNGARQYGLRCGAYHYYSESSSGKDQADYFIRTVPKAKGMLPPAIDIEINVTSQSGFQNELADFIKAVTDHYGVKPVFYVPPRVYNLLYDRYTDYHYWIIDYKSKLNPDVAGWTFWQYSNKGSAPGITSHVDLDVYQGSRWNLGRLS